MTIATSRRTKGDVIASKPVRLRGMWLGGGAAANCTRYSGRGITSVNYNAATGQYKITFAEVGKNLLGAMLSVQAAAGAATSFIARPTVYSASAKTLTFDVTDLATPTNHDLATTEYVHIDVEWDDSDAP